TEIKSVLTSIEKSGDAFIFKGKGYGHGVGMSQYGANVLAKEGKSYEEILAWYYTGTVLGEAPAQN
ncbi:MAG: stage II sporulation protein D, partial [Synergistales bacterium]|nr:stage II sporulation protein D [Synergistales bacterium]